jgi:aspartate aminotransferase
MYEKIWWGNEPFCSLLTAAPELYDRVVTINGVSKSYAMTGWRLGYCGGPKEIVNAMSTIQGQSTSNASSITQKAALAALNGDQKPVEAMNAEFKKRHDYFIGALNRLPGIVALPCAGAFYAWADCTAAMMAFGCKDDSAFAEMLINDAGVAVVPGSAFGAPGHFRASFATSMATLENCIERMNKVLQRGPVAKSA